MLAHADRRRRVGIMLLLSLGIMVAAPYAFIHPVIGTSAVIAGLIAMAILLGRWSTGRPRPPDELPRARVKR